MKRIPCNPTCSRRHGVSTLCLGILLPLQALAGDAPTAPGDPSDSPDRAVMLYAQTTGASQQPVTLGGGGGGSGAGYGGLVGMRGRPGGQALILRGADAEPEAQRQLEEDLAIMGRVLDKAIASKLGDDARRTPKQVAVFGLANRSMPRVLVLEDYGAIFFTRVRCPLVPPPASESPKPNDEAESKDTEWESARQDLYGRNAETTQLTAALNEYTQFWTADEAVEPYDAAKVEALKQGILEALKNAGRIRGLAADDHVLVVVTAAPAGGRPGPGAGRGAVYQSADGRSKSTGLVLVGEPRGADSRGSVMTVRVKKSDAEAFAAGTIDLKAFRDRALVGVFAAHTGGWGGGVGWDTLQAGF